MRYLRNINPEVFYLHGDIILQLLCDFQRDFVRNFQHSKATNLFFVSKLTVNQFMSGLS